MSLEQNKTIVRQFFEDAYNTGDLDVLEQILAPAYVDQKVPPGTPMGPAGIAQVITQFRTAFPDLRFTVRDQIAEEDRVVTRYTFEGTQHGELMGIPPSGKHVSIEGISIYRIADGKMQQAWIEYDMLGLLQRVGALPAPGQPAR